LEFGGLFRDLVAFPLDPAVLVAELLQALLVAVNDLRELNELFAEIMVFLLQ
jgi:hypothetical protein